MISYPNFGSYTPMFKIPDMIDEFSLLPVTKKWKKQTRVVTPCFLFWTRKQTNNRKMVSIQTKTKLGQNKEKLKQLKLEVT